MKLVTWADSDGQGNRTFYILFDPDEDRVPPYAVEREVAGFPNSICVSWPREGDPSIRATGEIVEPKWEPDLTRDKLLVKIPPTGVPLEKVEREALIQALKMSNWVQKDAAALLSISPRVMSHRANGA